MFVFGTPENNGNWRDPFRAILWRLLGIISVVGIIALVVLLGMVVLSAALIAVTGWFIYRFFKKRRSPKKGYQVTVNNPSEERRKPVENTDQVIDVDYEVCE